MLYSDTPPASSLQYFKSYIIHATIHTRTHIYIHTHNNLYIYKFIWHLKKVPDTDKDIAIGLYMYIHNTSSVVCVGIVRMFIIA